MDAGATRADADKCLGRFRMEQLYLQHTFGEFNVECTLIHAN